MTIPQVTIGQLKSIAPLVGIDPKNPIAVIVKALRLLDAAKNGKVTIDTQDGSYDVNLKNL